MTDEVRRESLDSCAPQDGNATFATEGMPGAVPLLDVLEAPSAAGADLESERMDVRVTMRRPPA